MLVPSPDETAATSAQLLQHVYNEILAEYSCFDSLEKCTETLLEFDEQNSKVLKEGGIDNNMISFYQLSDNVSGFSVKLQPLNEITASMTNNYHFLRGKAYNNRLVFSSNFTRVVTALCRAFTRFGNVTLVGPKGCGKTSVIEFCAQYLSMDLISCPPDNLPKLKSLVIEAYRSANEGISKLLFVPITDADIGAEIFDFLDKVFYYYDIPYGFSHRDKMDQLFSTDSERFRAVLDPTKLDEAGREMHFRIQDNLHVVISLRPDVFTKVYRPYSNLFLKSGTVRMTEWTEEMLIAIAEDRFAGLEQSLPMPIRNVSKTCASLHNQMTTDIGKIDIVNTQYLDMVKVLPQLFKPMKAKLLTTKHALQTGIDQVHNANTFINKLTNEISEKDPEISRMKTEIEQLNKRLSQERINLDRASKAFRKKEVAARKKSEETQELASDAHRNLEHAMPSLDAAMQAIHNIDKNDIMEMRAMKNPSDIVQQVMEAVCILLGVKADWATAKVLLADPALPQKLLDIDKDNIPEHVGKRIRRYIDNPKFIPDEVAKISRACCSMCMWVRAIDLYTKIFKSIEPKRVRLLQSESELAELMAALRAETDRVAHIESTIQTIQSSYQERVKRKAQLEIQVKQTSERLARAQALSYSLEEESQRWKQSLMEVEKSLKVLVGNSIIAAMMVAYGGCMRQDERKMAVEKWRKICDSFKIQTRAISASEFVQTNGITPLKNWLGKFEFYNQNYMSLRLSNKWPLLLDPHSLGLEALQSQNEHIITCDMHDDKIFDVVKQAVAKGQEVLILNFSSDYPFALKNVFERRLTERVHAFVGLMGIPIMRKDFRVVIDDQELVCNPKFKLIFHSHSMLGANDADLNIKAVKKLFNILNFEYSSEALDQQLLRKTMFKVDKTFCGEYLESRSNIRRLETAVVVRKDGVLDILLKCEDDVLDDKGLVVALKEAKAKVFEILNDLNTERKNMSQNLEVEVPKFKEAAGKMKKFTKVLDLLRDSDASCVLPKTGFIELIDGLESCESLSMLLHQVINKAIKVVLPSLRSKNRYVLQFGCNLIMNSPTKIEPYSTIETLMHRLFHAQDFTAEIDSAAQEYHSPANENDPNEEAEVKKNLEAMKSKDCSLFGSVLATEQTLIEQLDQKSLKKPLLIFHDESNVINACDIIVEIALREGYHCPRYLSIDNGLSNIGELNILLSNCRKEKRWVIVDSFHSVYGSFNKLSLPKVGPDFRIFLLSSHNKMKRFRLFGTVDALSLTHSPHYSVLKSIFMQLLELGLRPFVHSELKPLNFEKRMRNLYETLVDIHLGNCRQIPELMSFRNLQLLSQKIRNLLVKFEGDEMEQYSGKVQHAVKSIYGKIDEEPTIELIARFSKRALALGATDEL